MSNKFKAVFYVEEDNDYMAHVTLTMEDNDDYWDDIIEIVEAHSCLMYSVQFDRETKSIWTVFIESDEDKIVRKPDEFDRAAWNLVCTLSGLSYVENLVLHKTIELPPVVEKITLSDVDSAIFLSNIENPPDPSKKLKEACDSAGLFHDPVHRDGKTRPVSPDRVNRVNT